MREKVVQRFLKYVTFDTTANPNNSNCPSSEGQRVFANYLVEELKSLGLEDAHVDENSYVMATLKGNTEGVETIGFISHLDTAPDVTGKNVKPKIIKNYGIGHDLEHQIRYEFASQPVHMVPGVQQRKINHYDIHVLRFCKCPPLLNNLIIISSQSVN